MDTEKQNIKQNTDHKDDYKSFIIILACGVLLGVLVYVGLAFLSGESRYSDKASFLMRTIPTFETPPQFLSTEPAFTYDSLAQSPVHIVNFFASWCAPCVVEHPNLITLVQKTKAPIHGIVIKDSKVNIELYLKDHGNPYQTLSENNSDLSKIFNIRGIPETYVLNHEGRVMLHFQGPIMRRDMETTFLPLIQRLQNEFRQ